MIKLLGVRRDWGVFLIRGVQGCLRRYKNSKEKEISPTDKQTFKGEEEITIFFNSEISKNEQIVLQVK